MRAGCVHFLGAAFLERRSCVGDGAGGVDHVVDEDDVLAVDFTDDVHNFRNVWFWTTFVDDGQWCMQEICEFTRTGNAADVRGNDNNVIETEGFIVVGDDRCSHEMVYWYIEETLDLLSVQVHGENAASAGFGDKVGDELCSDRFAASALAVLTRIAIVWHDGGDATCRGAAHSVDHDEEFHEVVVAWFAGWLNDVNVLAPYAFVNLNIDLAVAKMADNTVAERNADIIADFLSEFWVGITGKNFHMVQ